MKIQKGVLKILAALLLSLFLSFSYLFLPSTFFSLDNRLRDFMFVLRGELPKNDNIVIVDIDEKSLKEYGQWPWNRKLIATLLQKINQHQPGIIGLDIVFAEEDRSSPHHLYQSFPNLPKDLPNYDAILANTFQTTPVIGGYIFTFDTNHTSQEPPNIPAIIVEKGLTNNQSIVTPSSVILNIPILQNALYSSGFFNNIPDPNGMIRRVPLIMKYDGFFFTSLPLEMVRIYSGQNRIDIVGDTYGVEKLSFGNFHIPIDDAGRLFVNFRGPKHHYTYLSAADILNDRVTSSQLRNKFVLLGTSALGLYDLRAIAFDSNIPGVEIHANVIDNLLTGDYISKPLNDVLFNLLIIWIVVFGFMFLFNLIHSWLIVPFAILLFYLLYLFYYTMLFKYGILLNLLFPSVAFVFTLILSVTIDYIISHKQKEEAQKILGKKVSPSVMQYLLKHAHQDLVKPKELEATIFFSDIQSFTSISEQLGSPAKLIDMLNTYMTPMVESIIAHQGTIDKFIGDAIMAYWNAPVQVENHADKAVKSAIEQIEKLSKINESIQNKYGIEISIGIGIHTGLVTAGDMGAKGRSDYTIIGDNVNLASRLEGLTRYYNADILISEATYHALQDAYQIRPLDTVTVKGKQQAVKIYEVLCNNKAISQHELHLYKEALHYFTHGDVTKAEQCFGQLQQTYPSALYKQYLERCHYFLEHPKEPFSPVLKMSSK